MDKQLTKWLKEYERKFSPITPREKNRMEFIKEMYKHVFVQDSETRMKKDNSLHCVRCGKELARPITLDYTKDDLWVCDNPECPNYGLVQVGIESMPKEKKGKRWRPKEFEEFWVVPNTGGDPAEKDGKEK